MSESPYRCCNRCVMDTSDPEIRFDAQGVCNHCLNFDTVTRKNWFPDEEGKRRLDEQLQRVRREGKGQEYDCIIGLSGGVDSSYLALKVKAWGLRPLVVHVDAGWNSELAVANIEKIVKHCGYDLHTHVVDWEEMRDLHLAYLKSGLSNQDVPQDHVFFASLYHFATKNGIRTIMSGGNIATESVFPLAWHGGSAMDAINLKAVHRSFGERRLATYNTISFFEYYLWYPFVKKMRTLRPLNFMPYDKAAAVRELEATVGWRSYGRKHGESLFTKLFQNDYLPRKFGYDKRLPHLSSMIMSGQMTRDQALTELAKPLYDPRELEVDIAYYCKKLRITREQYEAFIDGPQVRYDAYANWDHLHRRLKLLQGLAEKMVGRRISVYS